jgi:hypothetical protein
MFDLVFQIFILVFPRNKAKEISMGKRKSCVVSRLNNLKKHHHEQNNEEYDDLNGLSMSFEAINIDEPQKEQSTQTNVIVKDKSTQKSSLTREILFKLIRKLMLNRQSIHVK